MFVCYSDAGFSADIKHVFSDNYQDNIPGCGLTNANKKSSVRPMFIEAESSELTKKEMPVVFEPKYLVSTGKELGEARNRKQSSPDLEEQPFQGKMDRGLKEVFPPRDRKLAKTFKRVIRNPNRHSTNLKWKTLIGGMKL